MPAGFTPRLFDGVVEEYTDKVDLIITTIGLPEDSGRMAFWELKNPPKIALASGSVYRLKDAIKRARVVAAVTYSPDARYSDKPPPSDLDEAFDKHFLLITPDNIDGVAAKYPELFMR